MFLRTTLYHKIRRGVQYLIMIYSKIDKK